MSTSELTLANDSGLDLSVSARPSAIVEPPIPPVEALGDGYAAQNGYPSAPIIGSELLCVATKKKRKRNYDHHDEEELRRLRAENENLREQQLKQLMAIHERAIAQHEITITQREEQLRRLRAKNEGLARTIAALKLAAKEFAIDGCKLRTETADGGEELRWLLTEDRNS